MENNQMGFDPQDIQDNKAISAVGYLGFLFFLPLVVSKNSAFGRFHANQALVLFIASMICSFVMVIPIVGWIVGAVGGIACFVFMIMGIVNAASGNAKELPIIGKFRIIK